MLLFLKRKIKLFPLYFRKVSGLKWNTFQMKRSKLLCFIPEHTKLKKFFFLDVFWSWFFIHREVEFLPNCMKNYAVSLIHNCPIIYNLCLLLLNKDNFHVIIFLLVFSKPSITCFNRTSLWDAFLSKYIFQQITLEK